MRSWIARRMLRATSKRYGYDTGYLDMMLKESPSAFFKFASLMKAAIDLTLALQLGRMFPMVKAGLGYAKECRRVSVDGHNFDVIRQAA